MKLTFLGTSHGVPEPNRRCTCTMVEIKGRYYFVDLGIQVIEELMTRGIPMDAVKGIFLSHMHGDHTNGLISFVDLCTWYFKTVDSVICIPDMEGAQVIADWLRVTGSGHREIHYEEILPGVIFDDGFLKVTAIPTQHCNRSYALLLQAEGHSVLFTGDLKGPSVDFPEIARTEKLDLIICEAAHFPATDYVPILKECKVQKVCIHHYAPWNLPHILNLAEALGELPLILANDGMELLLH